MKSNLSTLNSKSFFSGFIAAVKTKYLTVTVTISLFIVMFILGSVFFPGFGTMQVFLNLFIDNAYLIAAAVGMTFVLLTGGIDISVGSIIALTCMASAHLMENSQMNPVVVVLLMLLMGITIGLFQGTLITYFNMQPFIVTLAGQFMARGLTAMISEETINISNPDYAGLANFRIYFGPQSFISIGVLVAFIVLFVAIYILHFTKFGRNIYAIGGNEQSAVLMGLPVKRTKLLVYTINGFCASIAGILFSLYTLSGYTLHAIGAELDAIASAVIGGTLLSGGVGYVFGSLFGALIQGIIQTIIMFQGTLSSWWTRIAVAVLLSVFIIMQSLLTFRRDSLKAANRVASSGNHKAA